MSVILWPIFRPVGLLAQWYVQRHGRALIEWRKKNDPEWVEMTQMYVHSAKVTERDGIDLTLKAKIVAHMANELAGMLVEQGAENYVQTDMFSPDHKRPVRFTVQWATGESPAEQNARLRKELAELKALLPTPGHEEGA